MASTLTQQNARLTQWLEGVVGGENLFERPDLQVDGLRPSLLVKPGSHDEVAECLKICADAGVSVIPAGNMTWLDCGNPVRSADVVLSVSRMNRVISYSPADLTATLEPGALFSEFNEVAEREAQWIPLDPPGGGAASIAGIVACASSGTLRFGFGTPRDHVLGLRLAHCDGLESRCGGKVVKNVAGYDMNKLYVGSFGTLGVITEVTVKLRPLPDHQATVIFAAPDTSSLFEVAARTLSSGIRPVSMFVINDRLSELAGASGGPAFVLRLADDQTALTSQLGRLKNILGPKADLEPLSKSEAERVWDVVGNVQRFGAYCLKSSVLIQKVKDVFDSAINGIEQPVVAADAGSGSVRVAFDSEVERAVSSTQALRAVSGELGGSLFIEQATLEFRRRLDAFDDTGGMTGLMREIKRQFDPMSILNPGKFAAGI